MNLFSEPLFDPILTDLEHHILAYILVFAIGMYSYSWGYLSGCDRYDRWICVFMVTLMDIMGCIGVHFLLYY